MRSLLNRAFSGLLAVLLGLGAFPVTSQAQHGGGPVHCPSAPTLIAGGDPTDCMYNGDVDLMADALQSFEGTITTSGDLTITGDTSSLDSVTFILTGSGDINIIDPGRLNDPNIRITTTSSTTPIILPTIISTIGTPITLTGTTPTFTLNPDSTLTLNTNNNIDSSGNPITITGTTPITLNADINSDLIATPITSLTINERQPLAVGSTISTDAGMLPIRAGNLILRLATSSSPAMMFVLSEGQSLAVGSTLTAIDGTTFTLSEGDDLILNTLSTTGTDNFELIDSNGNPITITGTPTLDSNNNIDINGNPITLQTTEEDTNDPTSSNNSSNTGAIVGGISGGVVLLTSIVYWFWPSDKAPLAQFQAFNADAYLPARQWIGMEHALTQDIKFAVGSFWLSDDTVNTIIPSMDNTGVDVRLSLAPRGFGEFSFSAAAYNYKDADSQYKEDGTTTDLFLDNFQVSNERLEFGYALGLQWRASF